MILSSQIRDICSSSTRQTTQYVTDDNSPGSHGEFCYRNTIQHYVKKQELFQGNLISEGRIFTKLQKPTTSLILLQNTIQHYVKKAGVVPREI